VRRSAAVAAAPVQGVVELVLGLARQGRPQHRPAEAAEGLDRLVRRDLVDREEERGSAESGGETCSRAVADVDALQNLYLRGIGPPLVAALAGAATVGAAAAVLPAAAIVLAAGLALGGIVVPALAAATARRAGRREATARGALSAELVEVLETAPELAAHSAADAALARVRAADRTLVGLARRDALGIGLGDGLAVTGATVAGVLAVAVHASRAGALPPVLIAMRALLALAAFEAAGRSPPPRASSRLRSRRGGACSSSPTGPSL
jgi:ATP-binding cassette, subfamily C, bacterial CydC